ncbi:hypothetical protein EG349_17240 [Chryseobacterium shandongense]|uniref:Uncharacterized protein n=1 Tax=Chryseobacterium shandongense TaxID=1493872 RepID=A0AAD0YBW4_9FLAO|nr:hypothetical protein [Chryseobacterium shandongense]AZA88391.1 hypothetical protein EG349_17240 [Chryseobacterium shandongense]AZA96934.1 hypothetical protein EG353_15930 [Chryseobacterium shandongense]
MKKILFILFIILFVKNYSQLHKLKGEWILDKIVKSNGEDLEINNPRYSTSVFYNINSNELSISDNKFKATFSRDQINLENRSFSYWFEDDYLLLKEGNEVFLLLKPEDFIKRYPEFSPEIRVTGIDTLLVANKVIQPVFRHEKTFDDFIIPLITQEASKDMDDLYFKISYILTKNNKISNIQIVDKRSPNMILNLFKP